MLADRCDARRDVMIAFRLIKLIWPAILNISAELVEKQKMLFALKSSVKESVKKKMNPNQIISIESES